MGATGSFLVVSLAIASGGLLPLIGLWSCAATGNIYAALFYPMAVASMTFIIGSLLLRETHGHRIWDEVRGV